MRHAKKMLEIGINKPIDGEKMKNVKGLPTDRPEDYVLQHLLDYPKEYLIRIIRMLDRKQNKDLLAEIKRLEGYIKDKNHAIELLNLELESLRPNRVKFDELNTEKE